MAGSKSFARLRIHPSLHSGQADPPYKKKSRSGLGKTRRNRVSLRRSVFRVLSEAKDEKPDIFLPPTDADIFVSMTKSPRSGFFFPFAQFRVRQNPACKRNTGASPPTFPVEFASCFSYFKAGRL